MWSSISTALLNSSAEAPKIFFIKVLEFSSGSQIFSFFLKTFLTFIENLPKSGKSETRFGDDLHNQKTCFFSKSLKVASLLWNESSKTFFLTSITTLHYHKLLSKFKKFEKLKKVSFKKHASTFLKGIFNEFWRREKSRRLPGVLFFVKFTTWDENIFQHNLELFYPKLARCFRFWDHVPSLS